MAVCVGLDAVFSYAFMFEKGFGIPRGVHQVKRKLKMRMLTCRDKRVVQMVTMQVRSIPASVGIKVGDFHMLERVSTPVFVHYVITNIVNLLVTL